MPEDKKLKSSNQIRMTVLKQQIKKVVTKKSKRGVVDGNKTKMYII